MFVIKSSMSTEENKIKKNLSPLSHPQTLFLCSEAIICYLFIILERHIYMHVDFLNKKDHFIHVP